MKRSILLSIFFMVSVYGVSQNFTHSYISNFAKLQGQLEEEFGLEKMRVVNFEYLTTNSEPYSLQVIGNSNYESFLKDAKAYNFVRILYLDDIDFKEINNYVFDKLKNLKAVRVNNCKNINFDELISNLNFSKELEQLHFKNLRFGKWHFNINKLSGLKVITFDNCHLKEFGHVSLNLDEFSISNSKNVLNLSTLFIPSVKKVIIKECVIEAFPYSLSTSTGLEYLDFKETKIRVSISNDIKGFKDLLYMDITDAKVNFKNVRFLDTNGKLFVIRGSDVSDDLIIDKKY